MAQPTGPSTRDAIDLSVLVPTYGRPDLVEALLTRLDAQTLEPSRFELILVDDGSPEPVRVDAEAHAFAVTLLRQDNAGPAAARNLGLARCRGKHTLILNDDAVPADNLLAIHLAAHAQLDRDMAVLGTFQFTERARQSPFVQLLSETNLLFDFPGLEPGKQLPWTFFWTCNISLATERLRAVGGFDQERFPEAIVEDVELGYRLAKEGVDVLYVPEAVAFHDHVVTPRRYFERALRLGVNLARMHDKHDDASILWFEEWQWGPRTLGMMQATFESYFDASRSLLAKLEQTDAAGKPLSSDEVALLSKLVRQLSNPWVFAGVLMHKEGGDAPAVLSNGPAQGELTSIVVVTRNALDQTRRCLEALRRTADSRFPIELICVDNGSDDGTAEYLDEQPDVTLVRNATNLGAPRARNQGLPLARGEHVVFMDSDVMVTTGWLERMLYHAQVDARSGVVGCLSDRAAHEQQIPYSGGDEPAAIDAFAAQRSVVHRRQFRFQPMLTSFLVLVRRELIDAIGGFDERFSPWGFEDDDFSLRAALSGFRNRVALDVFVRHEGYRGTKAERHAGLLERNWKVFARKWGADPEQYGDYGPLETLLTTEPPRERLRIPLVPAPLPSSTASSRPASIET